MNLRTSLLSIVLIVFVFQVLGQAPKIQPSPPIPVFHANSPREKAYLDKSFVGLTSDGKTREGLFPIRTTGVSTQPVRDAVSDFLSSLSEAQRKQCTFPIEDDEWRKWHNIELYERQGIALFEMNDKQRALAFDILETGLSSNGVEKARNIMAMEGYLKELSIEIGSAYEKGIVRLGEDKYWFSFMGRPSSNEPWGWQIDGHHLVVNYFVLGDQVVMTPTFMGSELTHIKEGPNAGIRTFVDESKKALKLYRSLDQNQRALATLLEEKTVSYTQAEAFRDDEVIPYVGIRVRDFEDSQKDLLIDLIEEYVGNMEAGHASIKMDEVKTHLDQTWFSWVGGSGDEDVFYYRIHSPVLMIEYDHHSPVFIVKKGEPGPGPVNWHVHTVVRTPNGNDYGKDLLQQHLQDHHHDHGAHVHEH